MHVISQLKCKLQPQNKQIKNIDDMGLRGSNLVLFLVVIFRFPIGSVFASFGNVSGSRTAQMFVLFYNNNCNKN